MTDWGRIRAAEYAVPEDRSVADLVAELVDMVASPDPRVRDETAYAALATWIDAGVVPAEQLQARCQSPGHALNADNLHYVRLLPGACQPPP